MDANVIRRSEGQKIRRSEVLRHADFLTFSPSKFLFFRIFVCFRGFLYPLSSFLFPVFYFLFPIHSLKDTCDG
jgi:hypothetical protein